MARPIKIGIDYFPFDVDMFEDEKIIPISSEFGAKGECVIVRVLCAIYRNGYFIECNDAFKFKIAKQASVSHSLVSEVIAGLVKWGFFSEAVFNSFGVLTSVGIQKRWKEATRKRVEKSDLKYMIVEFLPEETKLIPEETPLNQSESTQSILKESKVKKIPPPNTMENEILEEEILIFNDGIKRNTEGLINNLNKYEIKGISRAKIIAASDHGKIGHPIWGLFTEIRDSKGQIKFPEKFILSKLEV